MKKLLWFSAINDYTSMSRISFEMLKQLVNEYDIYILTNKGPVNNTEYLEEKGAKIYYIGTDTDNITVNEFMEYKEKNQTAAYIKYCVVQLAELVLQINPDYTVICNGNVNDIMGIIKSADEQCTMGTICRNSKLIAWVPIDVIPIYKNVSNLFYADILMTMTPIMADILKVLNKNDDNKNDDNNTEKKKCYITDIGHGLIEMKNISRKEAIKKINLEHNKIFVGPKIDITDIIILNANNYVPRKQLMMTIDIFEKICDTIDDKLLFERLKLWIHTDLSKFLPDLKLKNLKYRNKIILSNNKIDDNLLNCIYRTCQIGIQTSTGEGWSLTNCEHALTGAIQIVPKFLATEYHFKDNRGILIDVKIKTDDKGDFIANMNIDDYVNKTIELLKTGNYENNCIDYFKKYTWKLFADKFIDVLLND